MSQVAVHQRNALARLRRGDRQVGQRDRDALLRARCDAGKRQAATLGNPAHDFQREEVESLRHR